MRIPCRWGLVGCVKSQQEFPYNRKMSVGISLSVGYNQGRKKSLDGLPRKGKVLSRDIPVGGSIQGSKNPYRDFLVGGVGKFLYRKTRIF